ncbi:F-box protein At3g28330 [Eutrema salsugineum]|uniref:F-box protein At3g28330 n=1 Tax=Eutrema salsugineum TaxID=72664 RepID=UPI000CED3727|nr:F-box protein At3g28330 [Eutrema salsugineum]
MNSLPEDLRATILARLPLKSMKSSKLVCKEWKAMVESPFLRELFLSHHQNSHSSWSLMCRESGVSKRVSVVTYTDVGLILIKLEPLEGRDLTSYYVANPISRECIEIPPQPRVVQSFSPSGLATRIENGVVLGSWSFETIHSPLPLRRLVHLDPVCLNGKLYYSLLNKDFTEVDVVVSHDFYAEADQVRVLLFPDSEIKEPLFRRACTASQGFVIYMNADRNDDDASLELHLRVWRLKTWEWQLLNEISLDCTNSPFDYFPLATNPFDANTVYLQSYLNYSCLAFTTNLHKGGKSGLHNYLERGSDGRFLSFAGEWDTRSYQVFIVTIPPLFSRAGCIGSLLPHRLDQVHTLPSYC